MKVNKNIIFILFLFFHGFTSGQSLNNDIAIAMQQVRSGNYYTGSEAPFAKNISENPGELINALIPYTTDSVPMVRRQVLDLLNIVWKNTSDKSVKQEAVQYITFACGDKESGIAGKAGNYLRRYNKKDFTQISKDSLIKYIQRRVYYLENVVMVAGYLDLTECLGALKEISVSPKYSDRERWAARLAMARMGDNDETSYCINIVRSRAIDNAIVYNLLPDLVYTRQKPAFDYLVTILNSNEKSCISPNPDNGGKIICGYRVMEMLAPVIKDFPLETISGVNQIKTDSYPDALETARLWFKTKAGNYEIINETY